jgi:hypothetical protein
LEPCTHWIAPDSVGSGSSAGIEVRRRKKERTMANEIALQVKAIQMDTAAGVA